MFTNSLSQNVFSVRLRSKAKYQAHESCIFCFLPGRSSFSPLVSAFFASAVKVRQ